MSEKLRNDQETYEPPRALRLREAGVGSGVCGAGSGDQESCEFSGMDAAGGGCITNGYSAGGTECFGEGWTASGSCSTIGNQVGAA